MKIKKTTILYTLTALMLTASGCKKTYPSRDISQLHPDPIVVDPGTPINYIIFDNCESKDGWEIVGPSTVETQNPKEGKAYLKSAITAGGDYMHFVKKLTTPLNTKLTRATGQFLFWLYIADVSLIKKDGQIQISSSGDPDKNRLGWAIAPLLPTLKNGWNQLKLDLSTAEVTGDGGPDLGAMNYFRIFFWTADKATADLTVGIDDLKFLEIPEAPKPFVLFDGCDKLDGWDIALGTGSIETSGKKEGTGYIKSRITPNEDFMRYVQKLNVPIDTKITKENGQLTFWFYVADASQLKEGQIQISSAGDPDKFRYGWDIMKVNPAIKSGWNQLVLNLSDAYDADGGANLAAINYFRIFFNTTGKVTADFVTGIDGIKFQAK